MGSSRVSVVIPSYNRADTLGAAVASALAQEHDDLEVLVCDDGSTDGSRDVVEAFADPRVRWLAGRRSGGPSAPRNAGVRSAEGEWVAFLDSDDEWLPGKLAAQLASLRSSPAVMCTTNAWRVRPGSPERELLHARLPYGLGLDDLLVGNLVVTSSVLARREVLDRAGGFPESRAHGIFEDYALWLRVADLGPISVLPEPWVDYRDDASGSLRGLMDSELACTVNALRDFSSWRRSRVPAVRTTWRERRLAARQLAGLVAVRDLVRRARRTTRGGD